MPQSRGRRAGTQEKPLAARTAMGYTNARIAVQPCGEAKTFVVREEYLEYLSSRVWKSKVAAVKKRCGNVCERCHKFLVDDVHHLTYERIHEERLEDLQGLCVGCHSFLHGNRGIDPLEESIRIKVTWKVIEYWDKAATKFRRVRAEKVLGVKASCVPKGSRVLGASQGASFSYEDLGIYIVPMKEFLDKKGKPVFDPGKWREYRVAIRVSNGWLNSGRQPTLAPLDGKTVEREREKIAKRAAFEATRLEEGPNHYVSFRHTMARTPKEIRALFQAHPRLVERGQEYEILYARETSNHSVSLRLHRSTSRGFRRGTLHDADQKLADGLILLDAERSLWVVKEEG